MKESKIIDAIEEMVDKMVELGNTPYAIICSKKTWEKVALYFRKLSPIEEKCMPLQIWFKYEGGDLPILKSKYSPDDRIDVLDKENYERVMEAEKEFSQKTHSIFDKYPCELLKGKYK